MNQLSHDLMITMTPISSHFAPGQDCYESVFMISSILEMT
jgi:hypothetical protein